MNTDLTVTDLRWDETFRATDDDGHEWTVTIGMGHYEGRLEPLGIHVAGDAPLTRQFVRKIPFGTLFDMARTNVLGQLGWTGVEDPPFIPPDFIPGPQRGHRLTIDDLRIVSCTYKVAHQRGLPVVQAVADACGVSPSTAAKRIRAARDAGLMQ